jgi:hypothetical protein
MLAHGFASPRHRGFALVGNQCCTDSAATIAHAENARKSGAADFAFRPGRAGNECSDGDDYARYAGALSRDAERIVQMHPVGIVSKCRFCRIKWT